MAKRLVDLEVIETSGVDHPAHLHEGFIVMKAATPEKASAVFAALGKDRNMTGTTRPGPAAKAVTSEEVVTIVTKAIDDKLQPILDQLAQAWQSLREYGESADGDTPTADGVDPAAAAAAPAAVAAGMDPALAKAVEGLPDAVREALAKQAEQVQKAEQRAQQAEQLAQSERAERLDTLAIQKAKTEFGNLALSDEVVKSVRRLEEANPELHASIRSMLVAANAQLDGGSILKELGQTGSGATAPAMEEVEQLAKAAVERGEHDTIQKARAAVFTANPELAARVRKGE